MRRPIIDSRLFGQIDQQVFVSRLSVQFDTSSSPNDYGEIVAGWTNLGGLSGIPCIVSPVSGTERRGPLNVLTETTHIALLSTYLPQITTAMRALIDGMAYDITAVEKDSRHAMTRLQLKVAST